MIRSGWSQGHRVTGSQGHRVAESQNRRVSRSTKVRRERRDAGRELSDSRPRIVRVLLRDVAKILRHVVETAYLAARPFGKISKPRKVGICESFEPFSDVVHYGETAASDLIAKRKVFSRRTFAAVCADSPHQYSSLLPDPQIFEPPGRLHSPLGSQSPIHTLRIADVRLCDVV
jgi:hypothetical protein